MNPVRSMTSRQAASALHLSQSTLNRYAHSGAVPSGTLPSGHRRYNLAEVRAALAGSPEPALDPDVLLEEVRELTKAVSHLAARVQAYADRTKKGS